MTNLSYQGNPITQRDIDGFVNATEMAKANDVRFDNWTATDNAKKYLKALQESDLLESQGISKDSIIVESVGFPAIKNTWIHPLVAIAFAQWINPAFHVWCNQHIKTFLEAGQYSTPQPTNRFSIDNLERRINIAERYIAITERFNIPDSQIKTLVTQLICELPPEAKSKPFSLDMIYTKILKKATPEGITPAKLQQSIRELKTVGADVVKSYFVKLAEMGYGRIKEEGRSFIFFLNEAKINN